MKRYMLFHGDHYYPAGGMNDFQGSYDTLSMAVKALSSYGSYDWFHILDTKTDKIYFSHDTDIPTDSTIIKWAMEIDRQKCADS